MENFLERKRSFQFNLYAQFISLNKRSKKVILDQVAPKSVVFEVRERSRPNIPYLSETLRTEEIVSLWPTIFPSRLAQPNAFINGFDQNNRRKLLTMTVSNPKLEGNRLTFTYLLDKFEGELDVNDEILQWDGNGTLKNVSFLIDSTTENASTQTSTSQGVSVDAKLEAQWKSEGLENIVEIENAVQSYNSEKGTSINPNLVVQKILQVYATGVTASQINAVLEELSKGEDILTVVNKVLQLTPQTRTPPPSSVPPTWAQEFGTKAEAYYDAIEKDAEEAGYKGQTNNIISSILLSIQNQTVTQEQAITYLDGLVDGKLTLLQILTVLTPPIQCACNDGYVGYGSNACEITDDATLSFLNDQTNGVCTVPEESQGAIYQGYKAITKDSNGNWIYPVADIHDVNEFKSSCPKAINQCVVTPPPKPTGTGATGTGATGTGATETGATETGATGTGATETGATGTGATGTGATGTGATGTGGIAGTGVTSEQLASLLATLQGQGVLSPSIAEAIQTGSQAIENILNGLFQLYQFKQLLGQQAGVGSSFGAKPVEEAPITEPTPKPTPVQDSLLSELEGKIPLSEVKPTPVEPEPTFKPTVEPEPIIKPIVEPEPIIKPIVEPEPTIKPIVEPETTIKPIGGEIEPLSIKPINEPTFKPTYKPITEPTFKPTYKPITEPTFEPTFKPTYKPITEPTTTTFTEI